MTDLEDARLSRGLVDRSPAGRDALHAMHVKKMRAAVLCRMNEAHTELLGLLTNLTGWPANKGLFHDQGREPSGEEWSL